MGLPDGNKMSKDNAELLFITEIKTQFERDLAIKEILDHKSTSMITLSSVIFTALIAIATFALNNLFRSEITMNYSVLGITVLVALVLGMGSIGLFIWSYRLRSYRYPMGHELFFKDRGNGDYIQDTVNDWRTCSKKVFNDRMIEEYLSSIRTNSNSNKTKARLLEIGQWLFLGLIVFITIWSIILFFDLIIA